MYLLHLKRRWSQMLKRTICAMKTYDYDIIFHKSDNQLIKLSSEMARAASKHARTYSYLFSMQPMLASESRVTSICLIVQLMILLQVVLD